MGIPPIEDNTIVDSINTISRKYNKNLIDDIKTYGDELIDTIKNNKLDDKVAQRLATDIYTLLKEIKANAGSLYIETVSDKDYNPLFKGLYVSSYLNKFLDKINDKYNLNLKQLIEEGFKNYKPYFNDIIKLINTGTEIIDRLEYQTTTPIENIKGANYLFKQQTESVKYDHTNYTNPVKGSYKPNGDELNYDPNDLSTFDNLVIRFRPVGSEDKQFIDGYVTDAFMKDEVLNLKVQCKINGVYKNILINDEDYQILTTNIIPQISNGKPVSMIIKGYRLPIIGKIIESTTCPDGSINIKIEDEYHNVKTYNTYEHNITKLNVIDSKLELSEKEDADVLGQLSGLIRAINRQVDENGIVLTYRDFNPIEFKPDNIPHHGSSTLVPKIIIYSLNREKDNRISMLHWDQRNLHPTIKIAGNKYVDINALIKNPAVHIKGVINITNGFKQEGRPLNIIEKSLPERLSDSAFKALKNKIRLTESAYYYYNPDLTFDESLNRKIFENCDDSILPDNLTLSGDKIFNVKDLRIKDLLLMTDQQRNEFFDKIGPQLTAAIYETIRDVSKKSPVETVVSKNIDINDDSEYKGEEKQIPTINDYTKKQIEEWKRLNNIERDLFKKGLLDTFNTAGATHRRGALPVGVVSKMFTDLLDPRKKDVLDNFMYLIQKAKEEETLALLSREQKNYDEMLKHTSEMHNYETEIFLILNNLFNNSVKYFSKDSHKFADNIGAILMSWGTPENKVLISPTTGQQLKNAYTKVGNQYIKVSEMDIGLINFLSYLYKTIAKDPKKIANFIIDFDKINEDNIDTIVKNLSPYYGKFIDPKELYEFEKVVSESKNSKRAISAFKHYQEYINKLDEYNKKIEKETKSIFGDRTIDALDKEISRLNERVERYNLNMERFIKIMNDIELDKPLTDEDLINIMDVINEYSGNENLANQEIKQLRNVLKEKTKLLNQIESIQDKYAEYISKTQDLINYYSNRMSELGYISDEGFETEETRDLSRHNSLMRLNLMETIYAESKKQINNLINKLDKKLMSFLTEQQIEELKNEDYYVNLNKLYSEGREYSDGVEYVSTELKNAILGSAKGSNKLVVESVNNIIKEIETLNKKTLKIYEDFTGQNTRESNEYDDFRSFAEEAAKETLSEYNQVLRKNNVVLNLNDVLQNKGNILSQNINEKQTELKKITEKLLNLKKQINQIENIEENEEKRKRLIEQITDLSQQKRILELNIKTYQKYINECFDYYTPEKITQVLKELIDYFPTNKFLTKGNLFFQREEICEKMYPDLENIILNIFERNTTKIGGADLEKIKKGQPIDVNNLQKVKAEKGGNPQVLINGVPYDIVAVYKEYLSSLKHISSYENRFKCLKAMVYDFIKGRAVPYTAINEEIPISKERYATKEQIEARMLLNERVNKMIELIRYGSNILYNDFDRYINKITGKGKSFAAMDISTEEGKPKLTGITLGTNIKQKEQRLYVVNTLNKILDSIEKLKIVNSNEEFNSIIRSNLDIAKNHLKEIVEKYSNKDYDLSIGNIYNELKYSQDRLNKILEENFSSTGTLSLSEFKEKNPTFYDNIRKIDNCLIKLKQLYADIKYLSDKRIDKYNDINDVLSKIRNINNKYCEALIDARSGLAAINGLILSKVKNIKKFSKVLQNNNDIISTIDKNIKLKNIPGLNEETKRFLDNIKLNTDLVNPKMVSDLSYIVNRKITNAVGLSAEGIKYVINTLKDHSDNLYQKIISLSKTVIDDNNKSQLKYLSDTRKTINETIRKLTDLSYRINDPSLTKQQINEFKNEYNNIIKPLGDLGGLLARFSRMYNLHIPDIVKSIDQYIKYEEDNINKFGINGPINLMFTKDIPSISNKKIKYYQESIPVASTLIDRDTGKIKIFVNMNMFDSIDDAMPKIVEELIHSAVSDIVISRNIFKDKVKSERFNELYNLICKSEQDFIDRQINLQRKIKGFNEYYDNNKEEITDELNISALSNAMSNYENSSIKTELNEFTSLLKEFIGNAFGTEYAKQITEQDLINYIKQINDNNWFAMNDSIVSFLNKKIQTEETIGNYNRYYKYNDLKYIVDDLKSNFPQFRDLNSYDIDRIAEAFVDITKNSGTELINKLFNNDSYDVVKLISKFRSNTIADIINNISNNFVLFNDNLIKTTNSSEATRIIIDKYNEFNNTIGKLINDPVIRTQINTMLLKVSRSGVAESFYKILDDYVHLLDNSDKDIYNQLLTKLPNIINDIDIISKVLTHPANNNKQGSTLLFDRLIGDKYTGNRLIDISYKIILDACNDKIKYSNINPVLIKAFESIVNAKGTTEHKDYIIKKSADLLINEFYKLPKQELNKDSVRSILSNLIGNIEKIAFTLDSNLINKCNTIIKKSNLIELDKNLIDKDYASAIIFDSYINNKKYNINYEYFNKEFKDFLDIYESNDLNKLLNFTTLNPYFTLLKYLKIAQKGNDADLNSLTSRLINLDVTGADKDIAKALSNMSIQSASFYFSDLLSAVKSKNINYNELLDSFNEKFDGLLLDLAKYGNFKNIDILTDIRNKFNIPVDSKSTEIDYNDSVGECQLMSDLDSICKALIEPSIDKNTEDIILKTVAEPDGLDKLNIVINNLINNSDNKSADNIRRNILRLNNKIPGNKLYDLFSNEDYIYTDSDKTLRPARSIEIAAAIRTIDIIKQRYNKDTTNISEFNSIYRKVLRKEYGVKATPDYNYDHILSILFGPEFNISNINEVKSVNLSDMIKNLNDSSGLKTTGLNDFLMSVKETNNKVGSGIKITFYPVINTERCQELIKNNPFKSDGLLSIEIIDNGNNECLIKNIRTADKGILDTLQPDTLNELNKRYNNESIFRNLIDSTLSYLYNKGFKRAYINLFDNYNLRQSDKILVNFNNAVNDFIKGTNITYDNLGPNRSLINRMTSGLSSVYESKSKRLNAMAYSPNAVEQILNNYGIGKYKNIIIYNDDSSDVRGFYDSQNNTLNINAARQYSKYTILSTIIEEALHASMNDPTTSRLWRKLLENVTDAEISQMKRLGYSRATALEEAAIRKVINGLQQSSPSITISSFIKGIFNFIKRIFGINIPSEKEYRQLLKLGLTKIIGAQEEAHLINQQILEDNLIAFKNEQFITRPEFIHNERLSNIIKILLDKELVGVNPAVINGLKLIKNSGYDKIIEYGKESVVGDVKRGVVQIDDNSINTYSQLAKTLFDTVCRNAYEDYLGGDGNKLGQLIDNIIRDVDAGIIDKTNPLSEFAKVIKGNLNIENTTNDNPSGLPLTYRSTWALNKLEEAIINGDRYNGILGAATVSAYWMSENNRPFEDWLKTSIVLSDNNICKFITDNASYIKYLSQMITKGMSVMEYNGNFSPDIIKEITDEIIAKSQDTTERTKGKLSDKEYKENLEIIKNFKDNLNTALIGKGLRTIDSIGSYNWDNIKRLMENNGIKVKDEIMKRMDEAVDKISNEEYIDRFLSLKKEIESSEASIKFLKEMLLEGKDVNTTNKIKNLIKGIEDSVSTARKQYNTFLNDEELLNAVKEYEKYMPIEEEQRINKKIANNPFFKNFIKDAEFFEEISKADEDIRKSIMNIMNDNLHAASEARIRLATNIEKFDRTRQIVGYELDKSISEYINTFKQIVSKINNEKDHNKLYENLINDAYNNAINKHEINSFSDEFKDNFKNYKEAIIIYAKHLKTISDKIKTQNPDFDESKLLVYDNVKDLTPEQSGISQEALKNITELINAIPSLKEAFTNILRDTKSKSSFVDAISLRLEDIVKDRRSEDIDKFLDVCNYLIKGIKNTDNVKVNAVVSELNKYADKIKVNKELLNYLDRIATHPNFLELRTQVSSDMFKQMITNTQDGNIVFQEFTGIKDGKKYKFRLNQNEIFTASDELAAMKRAEEYFAGAEDYINGYDSALRNYKLGIGQHPYLLGYEEAVVNGLRELIDLYKPIYSANTFLSPTSFQPSRQINWLNQTSWFRQYIKTAENMPGFFGANMRAAVARLLDLSIKVNAVLAKDSYQKFKLYRHKALVSHADDPDIGNSLAKYYELVFNPLAHDYRMEYSKVAAGYILPTGKVVTPQDILLAKVMYDINRGIFNVIEQYGEYGIEQSWDKNYKRPVIARGEITFSRHINNKGQTIAQTLQSMYERKAGEGGVENATIIGPDGYLANNEITNGWDGIATTYDFFKYYVRDVVIRKDFRIRVDDNMRQAYRQLAFEMETAMNPDSKMLPISIHSLNDLVKLLSDRLPDKEEIADKTKYVVEHLDNELKQLYQNSKQILNEESEARKTIEKYVRILSTRNEFSIEANTMLLPSICYDYGQLHDWQMSAFRLRALAQPSLDLINSFKVAAQNIDSKITKVKSYNSNEIEKAAKEILSEYGGNVRLAETIRDVLFAASNDAIKGPTLEKGPVKLIREITDLAAGAVLANPFVQIQNMLGTCWLSFVVANRMSNAGTILNTLRTLCVVSNMLIRTPVYLISSLAKGGVEFLEYLMPGVNKSEKYLRKNYPELYKKFGVAMVNKAINYILDGYEQTRLLGLGERETVDSIVGEIESIALEDKASVNIPSEKYSPLKKGYLITKVGLKGILRKTGLPFWDSFINVEVRRFADWLISDMGKIAINYVNNRIKSGAGEFNPNDKAWQLQPEDVSGRMFMVDKATTIAYLRNTMALAGKPSLEKLFYDYYQRYQSNPNAKILEKETDDYRKFMNVWTTKVNKAWAGGNRAINLKNDVWLSGMSYLTGYVNNALLEFLNVSRRTSAPKTEVIASLVVQFSTVIAVAALIGMLQKELRERYKNYFRNEISKLPPPSSPSFWQTPKTATMNVLESSLMMVPWIGPIGLNVIGEIQGRRGYEPAEGIFVLSFLTDLVRSIRALNTLPTDDYGYIARLMAERYIPGFKELSIFRNVRPSEWLSGSNAAYQVLKSLGFIEERAQSPARFGSNITPSSAIKDQIMTALINNDYAGASLGIKRLTNLYYENAIKNNEDMTKAWNTANTRVRTEYKMMHPLALATTRRNLTEEQYNEMIKNMSDTQMQAYTKALSAWQKGAQLIDGLDPAYMPVEKEKESKNKTAFGFFSGITPEQQETSANNQITTTSSGGSATSTVSMNQPIPEKTSVNPAVVGETGAEKPKQIPITSTNTTANLSVPAATSTASTGGKIPMTETTAYPIATARAENPTQPQSIPVEQNPSVSVPEQQRQPIYAQQPAIPEVSTSQVPTSNTMIPVGSGGPRRLYNPLRPIITGEAPKQPAISIGGRTTSTRQPTGKGISLIKSYGKRLLPVNPKAVKPKRPAKVRTTKLKLLSAKSKKKIKI